VETSLRVNKWVLGPDCVFRKMYLVGMQSMDSMEVDEKSGGVWSVSDVLEFVSSLMVALLMGVLC
jgi:hypothetical protein